MFCPKIQEFNTKRPKYFIITGNENNIRHLTWNYEVKSMQFVFSQEVFKMPGRLQGFKRAYTASCMGNTSAFCLVGTAAGEVIVLHNPSLMFRTSFQANSHGILAMCCTKNGETIFTGGGGTLHPFIHTKFTSSRWEGQEDERVRPTMAKN